MSSLVTLKKLFNDEKIILVLIVRKVRRAHEWPNRQLIRAREAKFFIMDMPARVLFRQLFISCQKKLIERHYLLQVLSSLRIAATIYMIYQGQTSANFSEAYVR